MVIIIRIDNLYIGMILKNYKELCSILGVPIKTGNAKKAQLIWFEKHFTYKKDGNKFIIIDIFNTEIQPPPTQGGNNNQVEYTKNIEMLLLDILARDKKNGKIFLSKNKLFHMLEMVNVNYLDTNYRMPKLSKFLDIEENSVQEWFDTTGGMLERNLTSALKNLSNQSLIFWSKEITLREIIPFGDEYLVRVPHKNIYGEVSYEYEERRKTTKITREATDSEKKYILKMERETMDLLECENKQEVIAKGLWTDFENKVNAKVNKELSIEYYFQSYKILFNPDHILRKQDQINDMILGHKNRKEQKNFINKSIMYRVEDNAIARQNNAQKEIESDKLIPWKKETKLLMRSSEEYIEDNKNLNDVLISNKAEDIRDKVKKIELDT